ncbi:hypothetical protein ACFE04_024098 [Oxalis oulophora]
MAALNFNRPTTTTNTTTTTTAVFNVPKQMVDVGETFDDYLPFAYNNTCPNLEEMNNNNNNNNSSSKGSSFYIVRDDLLHPLINGNKARKLDGLLPLLEQQSVTHVVTCGGCQSAHAAAVERNTVAFSLTRGAAPNSHWL